MMINGGKYGSKGMNKMNDNKQARRGAPKKDPRNVRSERINLVLTPNTLDDLKTLIAMNDESMNNFIHELIDKEIDRESSKIEKYREFMEDIGK